MQPASMDTALKALAFVSPTDRDMRVRMGMALKDEFGDDAKDAWCDWGSIADNYKPGDANSSWKSFKPGGKVGIGSLFSEAQRMGFVFDRADAPVSPEQLAADKQAREERAAKAEADRLSRAAAAANRARIQWNMAAKEMPAPHPYLQRKQVEPLGSCRYMANGSIIVPMVRYDLDPPALVGKQEIAADGSKKYSGGMDKAGASCRLGPAPVDGELILVAEGYATGLSVRKAIAEEKTLFVAFDTSGLLKTAQIVRAAYPASPILFCADDDYLTGNKGVEKAQAAAQAVGCAALVLPVFTAARRAAKNDDTLPQLTDFNDLHVAESLDAVALQIRAAIAALQAAPSLPAVSPAPALDAEDQEAMPPWMDSVPDASAPAVSPIVALSPAPFEGAAQDEVVGLVTLEWALAHCALVQGSTDVWDSLNKLRMKKASFAVMVGKDNALAWETDPKRRSISPRNLPKTVRGVAATTGGAGDESIVMMLDRYTLLYGTKTVWDADKRIELSYDAMCLARGGDLASRWIGHPLHKEIDHDKLVFDPTQILPLDTHINMFEGFPLTPKQDDDKAQLVLDLLYSLCSSEANGEEVFKWLLCWLAYPLQHPGAKMQTGVLMFGEKQGTGKSLFFEGIMRPIYGEYSATVGQHELESQFTAWRSRKLYVLFEEILSRADKYTHFGLIKHMITGRDARLNEKHIAGKVEANHLNCVMLSNEFQALPLEPEDRRMLVVEAKNPLAMSLEMAIKALLKEGPGIIQAFYHFLLAYPLGDFEPGTRPVMTQSKQRVIRFGLPGWDAFYQTWSAGELDAPYQSCLSDDLYVVYGKWCTACGERALSLTKFAELVGSRVDKGRVWHQLTPGKKQLLSTFQVPADDGRTVQEQAGEFRKWMEGRGW